MTRLPKRVEARATASFASWRISSSSASAPMTSRSCTRYRIDAPRACHSESCGSCVDGSVMSRSRSSAGPPTAYVSPLTLASTPRPVKERKSAAPTSAARLAGRRHDGLRPADARCRPRRKRPVAGPLPPACRCRPRRSRRVRRVVSVPVLSKSTASMVRIRSNASRLRIKMPDCAASALDSEMTSGIASPSACGQAMTSTVTVRTTASLTSPLSRPCQERDQSSARGDVEEQRGKPVGQSLRAALGSLRLGDQALNAGERRVVADRRDLDPDRGIRGHCPSDHRVLDGFQHRPRLAGHHRLVDFGFAVDHDAVGWHACTGAYEHDVAVREGRRRSRSRSRRPTALARLHRAGGQPAPAAPTAPDRAPSSRASAPAA